MGGLFSTPSAVESSSSEESRVLSFHSTASWKTHFDSCKESNKLMVIDFSATWCGPCRFMEPILKDFAAQFTDVVFVKIDVDELRDVAQDWEVEAMPTFVLVKKGKEVDRLLGAQKDELKKKIEKFRGV
ncbi:thioredoxin H2-like protein [Cinnamomum micranthum f. kanehirae]|uniref:Thioredoxin H2-like protein n=1 Tax=Cinnamomum micranthum f. kanehirae TaxID=337451 RepID=A0A443N582_9MAGN|nr:thioredoxin H2-like protein [Cinnamomum micranthum f. kanehirae]